MSKSIKSFGYSELFHTFVVDKLIFCMKVIENTTAYKCEFCGRTSLRRHNMESHERSCRKNPKNRAMCYNCANFYLSESIAKSISRWTDTFCGQIEDHKRFFLNKCKHDDCLLFNRFHLHDTWCETLEDEGWIPMPSELEGCPNFKAHKPMWSDTLGGIW